MMLSKQEAKVFLRVGHHYVSETSEDEDLDRVFDAIHQTADYAGGDIKRWVKAVEQALDREDEDCDLRLPLAANNANQMEVRL